MKLYHSPQAPNPDRVVYFLRAKGKLDAVDLEEVSIMKQEHKTPEYREVSPFSQVPALVLDDGTAIGDLDTDRVVHGEAPQCSGSALHP